MWSATRNVKWRIPLPEPGNSTPIVWGRKVFLTQPSGRKRLLFCLDRKDGSLLWKSGVTWDKPERTHPTNPYCSASPVTDGNRVICWFGSAGVHCFDFAGNTVWSRDLGLQDHEWGYGSSPILHENSVILNFGPGNREFLIALDLEDGKTLWKMLAPHAEEFRERDKSEDLHGSWSTPLIIHREGKPELILGWPGKLVAYDPSTGRQLWECGGLGDLVYANPMWGNGILVQMGGYYGPTIAVRPPQDNEKTVSWLWRIPRNRLRLGTGIILEGYLYVHDMRGLVECRELATGEAVWSEKLTGGSGTSDSWSSMVLCEGNLFLLDKSGDTHIFKAEPRFVPVATNSLEEPTNSSIVISDREIFIRTHRSLWCIREEDVSQ